MNPMPEYQPIEPLEPMNNNPSGKSRPRCSTDEKAVRMREKGTEYLKKQNKC
jgi:hypothetical protein